MNVPISPSTCGPFTTRTVNVLVILLLFLFGSRAHGEPKVVLQILGSGGPFGGDKRASSGYLIWIDGQPRIMVDAGGGTFLRMQEAGARVGDLTVMCFTHLHPDHASDLPAILWSGVTIPRQTPLTILGPQGDDDDPGITAFLNALFRPKTGAFPWLSSVATGSGQQFKILEPSVDQEHPTLLFEGDGIKVIGVGVPHFGKPSLGYRIEVGKTSLGFGGDQTGNNPAFTELVQRVDLLVMHLAISEEAKGIPAWLHAKPSVVGRIAEDAKVHTLLLSHLIKASSTNQQASDFSLDNLPANVEQVRRHFQGELLVAEDLQRIEIRKP